MGIFTAKSSLKTFFSSPFFSLFIEKEGKFKLFFFLIFLAALFSALFEGSSISLIFLALNALNGGQLPEFLPLFVVNLLSSFTKENIFIFFIFVAVFLQVLRAASAFGSFYLFSLLASRIQREAQTRIYNQIFRFSFPFVSGYKGGDLADYASSPSLCIFKVMEGINYIVVSLFIVFILTFALIKISLLLSLGVFLLYLIFLRLQKLVISKVSLVSKQVAEEVAELSKETVQNLYGMRAIHTFALQNFILKNVCALLQKMSLKTRKLFFWNSSISVTGETVNVILVGLCLVMGVYLLRFDSASLLPSLLTFIIITYRISTKLSIAFMSMGGIAYYRGSLHRLNEILKTEDKEYAPEGGIAFSGLKKEIKMQSVSLIYSGKKEQAVASFSCTILKGTTTALVGHSGAGKSTVIDLLLRLYELSSGQILIDGVSLKEYSLTSWRDRLGVVSQDTFILNDTIRENIRFGNERTTGELIEGAASLAGAHEFISKLPYGYETFVGERGYKLSGGEKQRLALARALLRDPEILILDEATSHLDSNTEMLIQEALRQLKHKKTIIMIAHRLSTVIHADQILVMNKGHIVESGTHEDLISKQGFYLKFWNFQVAQSKKSSESDFTVR